MNNDEHSDDNDDETLNTVFQNNLHHLHRHRLYRRRHCGRRRSRHGASKCTLQMQVIYVFLHRLSFILSISVFSLFFFLYHFVSMSFILLSTYVFVSLCYSR